MTCLSEGQRRLHGRGFTLLEITLVLLIAAFLLSIVIPRFMRDSVDAKIAKTRAGLEMLRTAVALYYSTEGQYPSGDISADLAPYIDEIPADGFHDVDTINEKDEFEFDNPCTIEADYGGWCYCPVEQGAVIPNLPDNTEQYGYEMFSKY